MKPEQKYNPKYWFVHNINSDDVLLWTGSKSLQGAIDEYNLNMVEPFEDNPDLEVALVSLETV